MRRAQRAYNLDQSVPRQFPLPTSFPPVFAFSVLRPIFEQDSCPQLLHHSTFMNRITAKRSRKLTGSSEMVVIQIGQKMYSDKNRMHFFLTTFRVRNSICLSDIAMSLKRILGKRNKIYTTCVSGCVHITRSQTVAD
jgi:hypothetical protein